MNFLNLIKVFEVVFLKLFQYFSNEATTTSGWAL